MSVVLGLDLGANSLGWALIEDENNQIIDSGVRIFQEGVNDLGTAKEMSKNTKRRESRQTRRRNWRRGLRREKLKKVFAKYNLLKINDWDEIIALNPYEIRSRAVDEKISITELFRALYHINQRRGYYHVSVATQTSENDDKNKSVIFQGDNDKAGINEIWDVLRNQQTYKTLGQYLHSLDPMEKRQRNRYTERKMYIDEFEVIWNKQSEYHEILNNENIKKDIYYAIFHQRPLKSQKDKVGTCKFEKNKKKIPKSSILYQKFRMYVQLNNLKVETESRPYEKDKNLTPEETAKLVKHLLYNEKIDLKKTSTLKKLLGIHSQEFLKTNFDSQGKLDGVKTLASIYKIIGDKIYKLSDEDLDLIWHLRYSEANPEFVRKNIITKFGHLISDEEADKISNMKLEPAYGELSAKAIKKILPFLENGHRYDDAMKEAGYTHNLYQEETLKFNQLPKANNVRNPIVQVAMNQVRLVVNSIINRYGMLDRIRIEMARDLKMDLDTRLGIEKRNRENELKRQNAKKEIEKFNREFGNNLSTDSEQYILKYLLWEEANRICLYSGKPISISQLFSAETDIDHILPYSRTLDDSYMNKVVVHREINAIKGNRTPFEQWGKDYGTWKGIVDRANRLPDTSSSKIHKLKLEDLGKFVGEEGFISRQLNDTRYIARFAKEYLSQICNNVNVCTGTTTAYLRKFWGLNSILAPVGHGDNKYRGDHRHHTVDAIVIALTTQSILQKLSTYNRVTGGELYQQPMKFEKPWDNFKADVQKSIDRIIVSHKNNRNKVTGQLHDETVYGIVKDKWGEPVLDNKGQRIFVTTKPLDDSITKKQISQIVDNKIREMILARLQSLGENAKDKNKVPKGTFKEPLYFTNKRGKQIPIKSVRIRVPSNAMVQIRDYNAWAETGNNHHIIIFKEEVQDKKGNVKLKQSGKVVSLFEAIKRHRDGLEVIDKTLAPNQEFMFSLQKQEMFYTGELDAAKLLDVINDKANYDDLSKDIYFVQKFEIGGEINFRKHNISIKESTDEEGKKIYPGILRKTFGSLSGTKIKIDPIGFIEIADD